MQDVDMISSGAGAAAVAPSATVYLIDDDPVLLRLIELLLGSAGIAVESYCSAIEFLTRGPHPGVGCIVLDLQIPGMTGLRLQETMRAAGSNLPIVFLSGTADIRTAVRAMKNGAVDFLTKPFSPGELIECVRKALRTHREALERESLTHDFQQAFERLTRRERDVALLVGEGLSNKEIGSELQIAEKTVKNHRAAVIRKLKVGSIAELVKFLDRLRVD